MVMQEVFGQGGNSYSSPPRQQQQPTQAAARARNPYLRETNRGSSGDRRRSSRTVVRRGPNGSVVTFTTSGGGGRRGGGGYDPILDMLMRTQAARLQHGGGMNIDRMSYEELLARFGDGGENLGATEGEIRRLPASRLRDPEAELPEDCRQCHICLEKFERGEQRKVLPCLHGFHSPCIDKWLRTNKSCPICKHKIGANGDVSGGG